MLYGLDDITIIPSVVTYIEHRGDCSVNYQKTGMLPLFTAPMASVINDKNWELYANQQINTIIPRTIGYDTRLKLCDKTFVAMGLDELDEFVKESELKGTVKICLDIANGHMKKAIDLCSKAKEKFGDKLILMAGNIANPETYREYARAGVDYIRISVGSGSCCFVAGTKVTMADNSQKNIEEVDRGEFVKTLGGNYKVLNTFKKKTDKVLILNKNIQTTPDHKFLVIKKSDKEKVTEENIKDYAFYVKAKDLNLSEYLLVQDKNV